MALLPTGLCVSSFSHFSDNTAPQRADPVALQHGFIPRALRSVQSLLKVRVFLNANTLPLLALSQSQPPMQIEMVIFFLISSVPIYQWNKH